MKRKSKVREIKGQQCVERKVGRELENRKMEKGKKE